MLIEIRVPKIGQSEMNPSLGRWFKSVGDPVTAGEPLLEIEIGGKTIEIKAPATGVLSEVRFRDGQFVQAEAVLGTITEYGKT